MLDKQIVVEALRNVLDPEIGINIVELNMVRDIAVDNGDVRVTIALTVPHCPMAKTLQSDVEKALGKLGEVRSVKVETTSMSKQELETLRRRLQSKTAPSPPSQAIGPGSGIERLGKKAIRNIIAIISGKGGVGKSFVTSMLASELRRQGYEVGVLDADLTGPSIAKVFGVHDRPVKSPSGSILPVKTKTGIKIMSINLVLEDPTMPVIWRGPIVNSVIRQLYWDVEWGDLHYLLVDLPPGCVASDTLVYANPHPVPVNQLKPGDHVYSLDASISPSRRFPNVLDAELMPRRVLNVMPQGEAEVFELRTKTRKIKATYNHPVLALEKTRSEGRREYVYSLRWKRLTELRTGDAIAVVKKLPETGRASYKLPNVPRFGGREIAIPGHTTADFCRIIGYFMGDGFLRINPKTRTHQVLFAEPRNGKYRSEYVELLRTIFSGARVYQDDYQFGLLSRRVAFLFEKLGLHKSALEKRVPPWVYELPHAQIMAFIEGYCDADGSRRPGKNKFRRPGWMAFESPNHQLLEDMRVLAVSVGLRVTNLNSRTRNLTSPSGRAYKQTFSNFEANASSRSNRYGVGVIRGTGRQAVGRGLVNEYVGFERVSTIEPLGRLQVYDVEVEGNQNFVADGLIVHNTSDAPLTVFQSLPLDGVIVVSSPQELAAMIVGKAVNMAKKMDAPLLGLVENMSYLSCPHCGEKIQLFGRPQGERLSSSLGIPLLGEIPVDPEIARLSDEGKIEDCSSPVFEAIARELRVRAARQVEPFTQGLPIAWALQPADK